MAGETIQCTGTCTLALTLEPAPASAENLSDQTLVWGGFLLAAIVVFCLRKLANIFETAPHGD